MPQPILFRLRRGHMIYRRTRGYPGGVSPMLADATRPVAMYLRIFGITKDSAGAALPSCTVTLYRTADDSLADKLVSNVSGEYEFRSASLSTAYYVVAYKAGVPDLAGTTINTLIGTS